jgi:hypothetical protein
MPINYRQTGDRVPTRERGYRSANQNFRRQRGMFDPEQPANARGVGGGLLGHAAAAGNPMQMVPMPPMDL